MATMDLKGKRVLVTGSEGFIGSHVVERLLELGATVRAFVMYNFRGDPGWINHIKDRVEIVWGDIRDYNAIYDAMSGIDIVYDLAASISVVYSVMHPREVVETNVLGGFNVLMAAKERGVKRFVHVSTSETFGNPEYVPIDERHHKNAQSPYAASKAAIDKIIMSFYHTYKQPVVLIRPFNTFGPRQSPRAIIPSLILQFLDGNEIKVGNLDTSRDLTFVKDTAEGIIMAGLRPGIEGNEINLGVGTDVKIKDIITLIAKTTGKKNYNLVQESTRIRDKSYEIMRLVSDNKRAQKLLGWKPNYTFEKGLKETVDWFRKNRNEYKSLYYP